MPTCLYCHETKDVSAFNREHVVPEAFGTFEGNFVLKHVVCTACNKYFGDHLDIKLARDSIEGLDRYDHGIKRPEGGTKFGRSPRLTARVAEGFYKGAEVWWGASDEGDKLVMRAWPQFGISDESGGRQVWFAVENLPTKPELPSHGFPPGTPVMVKPFGIDPSLAEKLLTEKGFARSPLQVVKATPEDEIDLHIRGTVDRVLMRAVAKIAFNYLAFHYEGIARLDQFDAIRRYIRYEPPACLADSLASTNPVSLASGEFLAGLPPDIAPVAYGVGVSWNRGHVVAQVTLFFRFHYRIVLADGGFFFAPTVIDKAHLFNPIQRQIVELTSDSKRGRPIEVPKSPHLVRKRAGSGSGGVPR